MTTRGCGRALAPVRSPRRGWRWCGAACRYGSDGAARAGEVATGDRAARQGPRARGRERGSRDRPLQRHVAYAVEIPELRDKQRRAQGQPLLRAGPEAESCRSGSGTPRCTRRCRPRCRRTGAWELQGALRPGAAVLGYVTVPTTLPRASCRAVRSDRADRGALQAARLAPGGRGAGRGPGGSRHVRAARHQRTRSISSRRTARVRSWCRSCRGSGARVGDRRAARPAVRPGRVAPGARLGPRRAHGSSRTAGARSAPRRAGGPQDAEARRRQGGRDGRERSTQQAGRGRAGGGDRALETGRAGAARPGGGGAESVVAGPLARLPPVGGQSSAKGAKLSARA